MVTAHHPMARVGGKTERKSLSYTLRGRSHPVPRPSCRGRREKAAEPPQDDRNNLLDALPSFRFTSQGWDAWNQGRLMNELQAAAMFNRG
jgi:hypothetical protein